MPKKENAAWKKKTTCFEIPTYYTAFVPAIPLNLLALYQSQLPNNISTSLAPPLGTKSKAAEHQAKSLSFNPLCAKDVSPLIYRFKLMVNPKEKITPEILTMILQQACPIPLK